MSNRFLASRSKMLTVLMLLAMLLASVTAGASAQSVSDVSNPEQGLQPDKIIRTDGAKPGVYYIDYGSSIFNPSIYPVDGAIRFYGWNVLNPADGSYNWAELDNWIASRKAAGLGTGVMITTYDGSTSGDIRSTPNFVIKQPNAVLPATYMNSSSDANEPNQPHYANYWRSIGYNANFDYSNHLYAWTLSGNADIAGNPPADAAGIAAGYAGKLGGVDSASGYMFHTEERVPAMPAGISPAKTVFVTARIGIVTTDPNPNDHLYMELWDTSNNKLGGTEVDINNLSHANNTWADYEFDVSAFGAEKSVRVAFRVANDGANPTTFYVDNVVLNVRHLIPNYWPDTDAQRTYYKAYKKFITAFGTRYKNNADLQFVAIGAGVYGENQPTQSDSYPYNNFDHVVERYGNLTGADWVTYVNQLSLDYATAFSIGDGAGPGRHIFTQYAPTYKSSSERTQTTDYAQSVGVGLSGNFLPVDWTQAYRPANDGFYDPIRRYSSSVPIAFESYTMDLCNPLMTYWALYGGLDKHVDYLRADPTLIRNYDGTLTPNAPFFAWANDFMGKTAQTTPKVWAVMREHRNPTLSNCRGGGLYYQKTGASGGTYPQLGNFTFFLQQLDNLAGGKTVPETNDKGTDSRYAKDPSTGTAWTDAGLGNCPVTNGYRTDLFGTDYPCFKTPYNPDLPPIVGQDATFYNIQNWTGSGKEAYTVRRTDQSTNNPYMFFKIDPGYVDSIQLYKAKITVKYFDIGTDQWSLKYHSPSGEKLAGTVQKTGTRQLITKEFSITDLQNVSSGATFYLDSRDTTGAADGNEWIHMVEVERLGVGPAPTTGSVEGVAYHDANGNNQMDAGEAGLAGAVLSLSDLVTPDKYLATSGADGKYRFDVVEQGQYTLKENTAPTGYKKNTSTTIISVTANNTTSTNTNVGHEAVPVTPTPKKTYLPLLLR